VEWAPAKGPYETVDTYYNLDGTAGTFITTPDAAAWTFAGTYRVMMRVRATDWTAAATQHLATHYGVSGAFAWRFSVTTAGALQWSRSTDGLAEVQQTSSAPSLSNGTTYWLGVEYVTSSGAVSFYKADDAVTMPTVWSGWTLVSSHTMTSGTPYDSGSRLVLGATDDDKGRLTGRVYQYALYSTSTLLASLDADLDGYVTSPSVQVSSTGQTWTLQGAATLVTDWVDISAYVQEGSVQVGRQYEVDRFNAGTASLTLVARTRLFDPDNTAGTYYGQLVPMRQFRIRMVRSDTVYPVFRGYVTDWGQAVPSADRAIFTTVQLADAFALLDATLVPSVYEQAVLAKDPKIYYRFDNANALIDSSGDDRNGVFTSTPTLVDGLLTNDASRAWSLTGSNYAWVRADLISLGLTPAFEFWLSTTATTGVIADFQQSGVSVLIMLRAGKLRFWDSSSTNFYETTAAINDGVARHCYFDTTTDTWRIDGAAVSTTSGSETSPDELGGLVRTNGVMTLGNNQAANYPFVGTLDEFTGYASNVGDTYDEGAAPLAGQTTGVRVGALLDLLDWPAALRDLDAGDSTMQIFDGEGLSMLDAVQQAADTELGQTYVDAYGRVHHRSRSALWRDSRSQSGQSTFADSYGAPEYANLTGASGAFVSAPDNDAYTLTNLEIVARVRLVDWTPATPPMIMSLFKADPNRNWRLYVAASGALVFEYTPTGLAVDIRTRSSSVLGATDNETYWLKVTFENNVAGLNRTSFYWAADQQTEPSSWQAVGSTTSGASFAGFPNIVSTLELGSNENGVNNRLNGRIYYAALRNGVGGATVAEFNPLRDASLPATTVVSQTGETWTVNGAATLVDTADARYAAEGFSLTRDETLLRNPVSASRQDGTTITVSDSAGITKYGQRAWAAPTSYDLSDNVVNDRATFLLDRYKELTTRLESMTVHVHRDPATLTPVVGRRQIGDRVVVNRRPLNTSSRITSSVIIEGVAHRFAPRRWSTTYRASPIETTVFFILDDATYGVLDDDRLAY
jgi:hypothetical protein